LLARQTVKSRAMEAIIKLFFCVKRMFLREEVIFIYSCPRIKKGRPHKPESANRGRLISIWSKKNIKREVDVART
jgi:hypothetical protein